MAIPSRKLLINAQMSFKHADKNLYNIPVFQMQIKVWMKYSTLI